MMSKPFAVVAMGAKSSECNGGASQPQHISETELLLCCCARVIDPGRVPAARIEHLLASPIEWDEFIKVTFSHGVLPLAYVVLKDYSQLVPPASLRQLRHYFFLNTLRNERLTGELRRLLKLFDEAAIPVVPFKGSALGYMAYGHPSLRQFTDIDLMVRREDIARASDLLRRRGYHKELELMAREENYFQKIQCEHAFINPGKGFYVDLHWTFSPAFYSLDLDVEAMWQRLRPVSLGAHSLAEQSTGGSFAPEDVLLILAVNGGKDAWTRLLRVCDVAGIIRSCPELDWSSVLLRAKSRNVSRPLFVSLILARKLLGVAPPVEVWKVVRRDRRARLLANAFCRRMFAGEVVTPNIKNLLRVANLLERRRDKLNFCRGLALTPTKADWSYMRLPPSLFFLYYLLRPMRLLGTYFNRRSLK